MKSAKAEDSELLPVGAESSSEPRAFGCVSTFTVILEDNGCDDTDKRVLHIQI